MLSTIKKNITISATSQIDGKNAAGYSATINSENPEDVNFSPYQIDKDLYKKNRAQCRKDNAEFEDMVYVIQDQMIAEKEAASKTTQEE